MAERPASVSVEAGQEVVPRRHVVVGVVVSQPVEAPVSHGRRRPRPVHAPGVFRLGPQDMQYPGPRRGHPIRHGAHRLPQVSARLVYHVEPAPSGPPAIADEFLAVVPPDGVRVGVVALRVLLPVQHRHRGPRRVDEIGDVGQHLVHDDELRPRLVQRLGDSGPEASLHTFQHLHRLGDRVQVPVPGVVVVEPQVHVDVADLRHVVQRRLPSLLGRSLVVEAANLAFRYRLQQLLQEARGQAIGLSAQPIAVGVPRAPLRSHAPRARATPPCRRRR